MENDTTILLKKADHHTIMRQEGYYAGYYGSSTAVELVDDIREKLKEQWRDANGLYVIFYHSDSDMSKNLEQVADEIGSWMDEGTSIVFSSEIDDKVAAGVLEYEVLLSGIRSLNVEKEA